jgi:hypothetical protein
MLYSTECECENFGPCIQELNFECPLDDRRSLPDQLIHTLPGKRAVALSVYVGTVRPARRLSE